MQPPATIKPRDAKAAAMLATGTSMAKIAKELDCHKSTISRLASKPEIKQLISNANNELTTKAMVNVVDRVIMEQEAALNLTKHIINGDDNPTNIDKADINYFLSRADKTGTEILRSMGLLASNTQNLSIQNIYNDHRKETVSPMIASMLQGKMNDLTEDIPNAEYTENE